MLTVVSDSCWGKGEFSSVDVANQVSCVTMDSPTPIYIGAALTRLTGLYALKKRYKFDRGFIVLGHICGD